MIRKRIDKAMLALAEVPRPTGARKLQGSVQDWRIRIGDYRVLYEIDDDARLVTIWRIAHRSDVYR
jgi:mRNA interferase RelE/StbE